MNLSNVAILTCVPPGGAVHFQTAHGIADLVARGASWYCHAGPFIGANRNALTEHAMREGHRFAMMWDNDIVVPGDGLDILLDTMESRPDVDVLSAVYPTVMSYPVENRSHLVWVAQPKGYPRWLLIGEQVPNGVFECEAIGTGAMLTRLSLYDRLPEPWHGMPDVLKGECLGDGTMFCLHCRANKIKLYAHGDVVCEHHKTLDVGSLRNVLPAIRPSRPVEDRAAFLRRICEIEAVACRSPRDHAC
jgi:hypothetical protein